MPALSRRRFLALSGGAAICVACGEPARSAQREDLPETAIAPSLATDRDTPVPPTPTPTPRPVPPAGREARTLMSGTAWQAAAAITHSGKAGPVLLVLGGVHGNEPGGWLAADGTATLEPHTGSLLVMPRCNVQAIANFERTNDTLGDLNRAYPGDPAGALPMERMAAEIVALAREHGADVVLDLHESWAFYVDRPQDGTAFLGQTVTQGVGPRNTLAQAIVDRVNAGLSGREQLIRRDGTAFRRPDTTPTPGGSTATTRGRSSLSLGGHIAGLTPVLVEMGQEGQALDRRVELHRQVVAAALAELGMA